MHKYCVALWDQELDAKLTMNVAQISIEQNSNDKQLNLPMLGTA